MSKGKPTTKLCKHCKTEIPYGAKVCPQCRKKQGPGGCTIAILVVLLLCLIGSCFGGKSGDSEKETAKVDSIENESNETGTVGESETESEETTEEVVSNIFHAGDVLETKRVKLSFLSCGDYSDGNMFVKAGDGKKLIYFEFEFENIGDTDASVGSFDFDCYADGYESKQSYTATGDNVMTSITTLSPGRKTSGIVVFEVPKDAESIEVEYETSYWTQDKAIFVFE